ncbi:unnamed protein product [Ixodes pacificus]
MAIGCRLHSWHDTKFYLFRKYPRICTKQNISVFPTRRQHLLIFASDGICNSFANMANLVQQSDQRHIASVSSKRGSNESLLGANLHLCTQILVGAASKGASTGGF